MAALEIADTREVMDGKVTDSIGKSNDSASAESRSTLYRHRARRIRLHDVRHSYARLALDSGIDPKILSDRVGHANLNVTLGQYVHRSKGRDREAAEQIAKAIEGALYRATTAETQCPPEPTLVEWTLKLLMADGRDSTWRTVRTRRRP